MVHDPDGDSARPVGSKQGAAWSSTTISRIAANGGHASNGDGFEDEIEPGNGPDDKPRMREDFEIIPLPHFG